MHVNHNNENVDQNRDFEQFGVVKQQFFGLDLVPIKNRLTIHGLDKRLRLDRMAYV